MRSQLVCIDSSQLELAKRRYQAIRRSKRHYEALIH